MEMNLNDTSKETYYNKLPNAIQMYTILEANLDL